MMTDAAKETGSRRVYSPAVDIIKRREDIEVVADMPGVDETTLEVTVEKNVLTIYGRVAQDRPDEAKMAYSEYGVGDYKRVFTISDEIDRERILAKVKDGVLRLTLPKAEAAKTRKVPVKAAD